MTKKIGAVLILSVLLSSGAFAVPDLFNLKSGPTPQKNAVFVDVDLVGLIFGYVNLVGINYERAFGNSWTGLIRVAIGGNFDDTIAFQIDVHGRWYIFKTALDKLFVDLGLGYEYYGYTNKNDSDWNWSQSSLTIIPKAGWKFIFWKGFVVEPSLGYTIGIPLGTPERYGAAAYVPGGFNIGLALGWAF